MLHQLLFPSSLCSLLIHRKCSKDAIFNGYCNSVLSWPNLIQTIFTAGSCDQTQTLNSFNLPTFGKPHKPRSSLLPKGNLLFKFGDIFSFPLICHYSRTFNRLSWWFFLNFFSISLPLRNQLLSHLNNPHSYFFNTLLFLSVFPTYFLVPENSSFFSLSQWFHSLGWCLQKSFSYTVEIWTTQVSAVTYPLVYRSFGDLWLFENFADEPCSLEILKK